MDYYLINGYGYLVKNGYSNFLLIPFAELSRLIGVKQSYNLLLLTSTAFCALSCYFSFNAIIKNKFGAIIFTLLYTTSSYRFICLYERSALGETLAISFIPLIIWGLYEVINGDYKKFYILSVGFSLMLYAHAITSFLFVLVCSTYFLINIKQIIRCPIRLKYLMYSGLLCILLSLYHLLPYFEMLNFDKYRFNNYDNPVMGLKLRSIIYGALTLYYSEYEPYIPKIGLLIAIPPILLRFFVNRKNTIIRHTDIILIIGIILLFTCTHHFPWSIVQSLIKQLGLIQFSYRLFTITTVLFTYCTAVYCSIIFKKNSQKLIVFSIFFILTIVSLYFESFRYKVQTKLWNPKEKVAVTTGHRGILGAEFLPDNFIYPLDRGALTIENINLDTKTENISKIKGHLVFDLQLTKSDTLILPLTYYKGYEVKLNNQGIKYFSTNGMITINPSTSGKVEVQYVGTYIIKSTLAISSITCLILVLYILRNYKRTRSKL